MDFQNEYDSTTSDIDTLVSTQLSSSLTWANVPGGLIKASSSSAGYVWGYQYTNVVYVCELPCTGNWKAVDLSKYKIASIQDLVTDNSNVYVLITDTSGKNNLLISPANNQGTWNMIAVPFNAKNIFSTNTYIWAQDASNQKQKCAKPCTTGNWIAVPENKVTITSASNTSLYGKDATGNALKTDENMQAAWTPISGLTGLKLASIMGQADKTALYGIDTSSKAYRCEGDCTDPSELNPLDTAGYMPLNLSPSDKNLWMTTTTSGDTGNIFTRVDKADYTSIMDNINPLDQKRDKIISDMKDEYNSQTNTMIANKQVTGIVDFFSKFFKFDSDSSQQYVSDASAYKDKINLSQKKLEKLSSTEPVIQKIIVILLAVVVVYLLGTFLGEIVHIIAFIVLAGGFGYIYYSSKS